MKYFIITGASKGLGAGIASALLADDHHLFCISRGESQSLTEEAAAKNCTVDFFLFDLAVNHDIPGLVEKIFQKIDRDRATGIYLVNNAGVIKPVGRIEDTPADAVEMHMRINLLAPMLLTAAFVKHTKDLATEKRILNISSGAAQHPYYGWSSYCTAKAGLEMFGRCMHEEQKDEPGPVKSMSVAPGIIDTEMQTTIRGTSERAFIHREKFIELKESGQLVSPSKAGKRIARLLLSSSFKDGDIIDLRDS